MSTGRMRARDGWLVVLAVLGVIAVSIAAHSSAAVDHTGERSRVGVPVPPPEMRAIEGRDLRAASHPAHWHLSFHFPWLLFRLLGFALVTVLILLLILFVIKVVPRIGMGRRIARGSRPDRLAPEVGQRLDSAVSATFDEALAGLRRGDREQAIINCWLRLDELAGQAGYPARSWQTSGELTVLWRDTLELPAGPLAELAELYREARFSSHRMSTEAVERARQTLTTLRAALSARAAGMADG